MSDNIPGFLRHLALPFGDRPDWIRDLFERKIHRSSWCEHYDDLPAGHQLVAHREANAQIYAFSNLEEGHLLRAAFETDVRFGIVDRDQFREFLQFLTDLEDGRQLRLARERVEAIAARNEGARALTITVVLNRHGGHTISDAAKLSSSGITTVWDVLTRDFDELRQQLGAELQTRITDIVIKEALLPGEDWPRTPIANDDESRSEGEASSPAPEGPEVVASVLSASDEPAAAEEPTVPAGLSPEDVESVRHLLHEEGDQPAG